MAETNDTIPRDNELLLIDQEKESAYNYRERRHDDWKDNYTLSRDKVITNRLIQRQTINIPLMKYGLATILKDIDEPAVTRFINLSNDEGKEIFYNEAWKEAQRLNKNKLRERAFKKHLLLYGRAFKKLNIVDGKFKYEIILPEDMLVERYVDPLDIDSSRVTIQINIFRKLDDVLSNDDYDQADRNELKKYFDNDDRRVESATNADRFRNQSEKLSAMGVTDTENPVVGTTYLELNEVYRSEFDKNLKRNVMMLYVGVATANGFYRLSKKPLHEVLGKTKDDAWFDHIPFTTAGADPEADDFWSDAPADTLRQPNKVLNSFVSSMVENRILRNYNMHYYDSSDASFIPQVFQPGPWVWLPVPGNPHDKIKDVVVGDLSESLDEMQFVIGIAEKAVAATSVQTGELPSSQVKLGQTEIALVNAKERVKSMILPINQELEDFAQKYIWLIEGASSSLNDLVVHKKGREGKRIYTATIKPSDYADVAGYVAEVQMKEDQDAQEVASIQKLQVAKAEMPTNIPLTKIIKKRLLDFCDLKSDEVREVLEYEDTNAGLANLPLVQPNGQPMNQGQPASGMMQQSV